MRISSEEFHRLAEEVEVLRDELSALHLQPALAS